MKKRKKESFWNCRGTCRAIQKQVRTHYADGERERLTYDALLNDVILLVFGVEEKCGYLMRSAYMSALREVLCKYRKLNVFGYEGQLCCTDTRRGMPMIEFLSYMKADSFLDKKSRLEAINQWSGISNAGKAYRSLLNVITASTVKKMVNLDVVIVL